jgi:hypothetical protein
MSQSHVHQRSDERYYSAFLDRILLDLYRPPRAG